MKDYILKYFRDGSPKTILCESTHPFIGYQILEVGDDDGLGNLSIIFHNTHPKGEHVLIDETYIERLKNLLKIY